MLRSAALRQAVLYGLGILVTKGVSLAMLPVVTAHLPPAEYGRLEVLQALADICSILVGFGLVDAFYRFAGDAADADALKRLAATAFGWSMLLSAAIAGPIVAAAPLLAAWLPGEPPPRAVALVALTLVLDGCIQMPLAWLRMRDQAARFVVTSVLRALLQAALVVVALRAGTGIDGVAAAGLAAALFQAAILATGQLRATGLHLDLAMGARLLRYAAPLVLSGVAGFFLAGFDRWALAAQLGPEEMAIYALAAKFALVVGLVLQPFGMWWYPRRFVALAGPDGPAASARVAALGVGLGVAAALAVAVAGPVAIRWLTPPVYHGAAALLPWLAAIHAIKNAGDLMNVGCYVGRDTVLPTGIGLASAGVLVAGLLALVPVAGVPGAIGAAAAAWTLRLASMLAASQRRVRLPYPAARLAAIAALGLAGTAAASLAGPALGPLAAVAAAIGVALLTPMPGPRGSAWPMLVAAVSRLLPRPGACGRSSTG